MSPIVKRDVVKFNDRIAERWIVDSWVIAEFDVHLTVVVIPSQLSWSQDTILWPQMFISMQLQLLVTRLSLMYSFIPAFPKVYNK